MVAQPLLAPPHHFSLLSAHYSISFNDRRLVHQSWKAEDRKEGGVVCLAVLL